MPFAWSPFASMLGVSIGALRGLKLFFLGSDSEGFMTRNNQTALDPCGDVLLGTGSPRYVLRLSEKG